MKAKSAYFTNSNLETSEHTTAVVPLISEDKRLKKLFFIGTAFYISGNGILMTAKHNLFNRDQKLFNNLGVYHFLPENKYILRPIRKLTYSNDYDIAYLLPAEILYKGRNKVGSSSLVLTDTKPEVGQQLGTYCYPNSKLDNLVGNFKSRFYLGNCTGFHPNGFSLLKNPCYQTSIQIKSGASGGPVFDKNGKVFAICSTSFDLTDGEENISFVTPVSPSFNMILEDEGNNKVTVLELIERNIIKFEKNNSI